MKMCRGSACGCVGPGQGRAREARDETFEGERGGGNPSINECVCVCLCVSVSVLLVLVVSLRGEC